jgi:hypothetical protein
LAVSSFIHKIHMSGLILTKWRRETRAYGLTHYEEEIEGTEDRELCVCAETYLAMVLRAGVRGRSS